MYTSCILCNTNGKEIELNNLQLLRCPMCGLTWRKDFSLPASYYEQKKIDVSAEKQSRRARDALGRLAIVGKIPTPSGLCDIGSGEGVFLAAARDKHITPLLGIDPTEEAVAIGHEKGITMRQGRVEQLSELLHDFPMRIATLFHVIEHLSDPKNAIEAIFRALPNGGYVVIETPNFNSYVLRKSKYKNSLVYPEHFFYFSEATIQELLMRCGFSIIAHGRRNFDQKHMSIRDSLYRLGLSGAPTDTGDWNIRLGRHKVSSGGEVVQKTSFAKKVIARLLAWVVIVSGRTDYLWVIAQKIDNKQSK